MVRDDQITVDGTNICHVRPDRYAGTVSEIVESCRTGLLAALPAHIIRQLAVAAGGNRDGVRRAERRIVQLVEPEAPSRLTPVAAFDVHRGYVGFAPSMLIVDRRLAMVWPLASHTGQIALLIRGDDAIAGVMQEFERVWAASTPLHEPVGNDRRHAILTGLARGQTDSAIAAALRVGERTIRREVNVLMSETGARSRFQLGMYIAGRGLVHPLQAADNGTSS